MSYFTGVFYSDTGSLDAFSRLRVSNPEHLFSVQCQYNVQPREMEAFISGTGVTATHSADTRMVALTCNAGNGVSAFQSYQYSPYCPGKSHLIAITGVMGTGVAGATVDAGYFDASNGVIFRQNGVTNLQLILRTSTSGVVSDANIVAQANWNIDTLLGTGASGLTLDITKAYIMLIDLQFLGMGRVRIGFDIDGVLYYVHQFENANNLAVPYMQSATLPIQMLVTATGTAGAKTSYFKCAAVASEGGSIQDYGSRGSTPQASVVAGSGTRTHLVSFRPLLVYPAASTIPNRALAILENINMLNTGSNPVRWELINNATFSVSPTWNPIDTTNSAYEYGTGGTYTAATGAVLAGGFLGSTTGAGSSILERFLDMNFSLRHPIALNRAGANTALGTMSLFVTGIGGAATSVYGSLDYTEIH